MSLVFPNLVNPRPPNPPAGRMGREFCTLGSRLIRTWPGVLVKMGLADFRHSPPGKGGGKLRYNPEFGVPQVCVAHPSAYSPGPKGSSKETLGPARWEAELWGGQEKWGPGWGRSRIGVTVRVPLPAFSARGQARPRATGVAAAQGFLRRPASAAARPASREFPVSAVPRAERASEAWRWGLGAGDVWVLRPMAGGRPSAARPPRPPPPPSPPALPFPPPPPRRQLRGASLKSAREL